MLFGTFGFRGIAGKEINTTVALLVARAFANSYGLKKVVIGRDVRRAGEALYYSMVSALIEEGVEVVDAGLLPTPALQFAVKELGADGGIMITASHNPPEYIGIKLVDERGVGISRERASRVEEEMKRYLVAMRNIDALKLVGRSVSSIGKTVSYSGSVEKIDVVPRYVETIIDTVGELPRKMKIVFDASSSVGSLTVPRILRGLGARVLTVNSVLDGDFSWRNPEPSPENIGYLGEVVKSVGADLGFAVDGDADRLVVVTRGGKVLQGDKTFALIVNFLPEIELSRVHEKIVVTTVATSNIIHDVARMRELEVIETKVGDPYVSEKCLETDALVGGEENGGVIYPWWVPGRDSGMSAALLSKLASIYSIESILEGFPNYHQIKTKIPGKVDYALVKSVVEQMGIEHRDLDGIKLYFEKGWVLIRNSGTEPFVRIFAESTDENVARKLIELGKEIVGKTMGELKIQRV